MDIIEIQKAIEKLYYEINGENGKITIPITCSMQEEHKHNCFTCNMAESIDILKIMSELILNNKEGLEGYKLYRILLPQIYIIVEGIDTLFKNVNEDINKEYKKEILPFICRVRRLMNFLKHPKTKLFFKHPNYLFIQNSKECPQYTQLDVDSTEFINFLDENVISDKEEKYVGEIMLHEFDIQEWQKRDLTSEQISQLNQYSYVYFCEKDIEAYYSKKKDNIKPLDIIAGIENVYVILPLISDLIEELKTSFDWIISKKAQSMNVKKYQI